MPKVPPKSKSNAASQASEKKSGISKAKLADLDETGKRKKDRRSKDQPVVNERRKAQRRRQIDPTTCERDYDNSEIEFMHALDQYKRDSGRMFPTCSEILEVLVKLGYRKVSDGELSEPASPEHSEGKAAEAHAPADDSEANDTVRLAAPLLPQVADLAENSNC